MAWWWSWLLTMPQLFAYWQVGNRRRWGWLVAFCGDVLWVIYSLVSRQYGFLVSAVLFGGLAARNWRAWGAVASDR
jgi:hypothetical protein